MKKRLALVIIIGIISIIGYLSLKERKIIILAYHKVVPDEIKNEYFKDNDWVDTTERFKEQMKYLHDHHYKTISMDEYEEWRNTKKKLPIKTVMITIDDGDLGIYHEILPILKKYNFKATYFMIGEYVKEKSDRYVPSLQQFLGKDLIDRINHDYPNLEIQSHSYGMHNRNDNVPYVVNMNKEEIAKDFDKMRFLNTNIYCYPYGVHTNDILEVLKEKNYRMAFKLDKSGLSRKSDNKYLIERVGINSKTSFNTFKRWLLKEIIM